MYNIAPEILFDCEISSKSDIWSFGCCLYEMVKLEKLFDGKINREIERNLIAFGEGNLSLNLDLNDLVLNNILKKYVTFTRFLFISIFVFIHNDLLIFRCIIKGIKS